MKRDYRLDGPENLRAYEQGLVEAPWYISGVPREQLRRLMKRKNGPALFDTLLWFGLLGGSGYLAVLLWGSGWMVLPLAVYWTVYGSTSDSRWHESLHGTAFRSTWLNNLLYEIASFMVFRESTPWRWSHIRHHSDTIIRGRDPEIAVQRPPDLKAIFLELFNLKSGPREFRKMLMHVAGRLDPQEATYIPVTEKRKVFLKARIYIFIYACVLFLSAWSGTLLPVVLIGLPSFCGAWLKVVYGLTQHAGLAENVLDHRLNSRTVYLNRIHRYLYWNMNYHIEHHMFPMVPYHALAGLHELVKDNMPEPRIGLTGAYREVIPALLRQVKDPDYTFTPELPGKTGDQDTHAGEIYFNNLENRNRDGLLEICPAEKLGREEAIRFDTGAKTFTVYRSPEGKCYATDGICTHGNTHLSGGLILGNLVECPKHNGRFDYTDGSPRRPPVSRGLHTYEIVEKQGVLHMAINREVMSHIEQQSRVTTFRVTGNRHVATYIRELVLEPLGSGGFSYKPGDYLKLEIPPYHLKYSSITIENPYADEWMDRDLFRHRAFNKETISRNYSMASNPFTGTQLRFNVRIALPPAGVECSAGAGSSYVLGLKPGDIVRATGPFGDFHIREGSGEMVYIGGGSGMAPLRSHISFLFETLRTQRKVSFWYGARSGRELFYTDYFEGLARERPNFSFHVALSEPRPEDQGGSYTGMIHEVVRDRYLDGVKDPSQIQYYLCGPPVLISAVSGMLSAIGVPPHQVFFDEFT